jgi:hypothetical protein
MGMMVSSQNGLFQHVSNVYLRGENVSTRIARKATVGEIEWLLNKRQRFLNSSNGYSPMPMNGPRRSVHSAMNASGLGAILAIRDST